MKLLKLNNKLTKLRHLLSYLISKPKLSRRVPDEISIGFAILAHERPEYLEKCLDTLYKSNVDSYKIDFFILDDGSKNPDVQKLISRPAPEHLRVFRHYFRKGPSNAGAVINRALKHMLAHKKYSIVGWADPDCIFHPEWLNKTMSTCLWAKANHKEHILGPFTSFNSSDFEFHKILGQYDSPFGKYVVKRQAGMLNYFFFTEDLNRIGFFDENKDDEYLMTWRLELMKVRNFSTSTSWVEHIGVNSSLKDFRPESCEEAPFAINLAEDGWSADPRIFRPIPKDQLEKMQLLYEKTISKIR